MTRIDPPSSPTSAWKHLVRGAGLGLVGCLALAAITLACSEAEDLTPIYAGTCPVLLECANRIDPNSAPALFEAYGDPSLPDQGGCWTLGQANHVLCRSSCVEVLINLNLENTSSCGECQDDGDCVPFGSSATCRDGYCARATLGDIELETTTSAESTETGDTSEPMTDVPSGLDPNCAVASPQVVFDTSLGQIIVEIDKGAEPKLADAFLRTVTADVYDGSLLHRVVEGVFVEGGSFATGFNPIVPLELIADSGAPALAHGPDSFALIRHEGQVGAGFYFVDPPGPTAPSGVPIGTIVAGAEVRDAIAAVEVDTLTWQGFTLEHVPVTDVVISEVYCD